jgi:putative acetyltransferase
VVSLVAEAAGAVVGHVLFSPVAVDPQPGPSLGVGLAPLAVVPGQQRRSIGSRLVASGLEACLRGGFGFAVVLGAPGYYHRFGFRRARAEGLCNEYGIDEEFMVLELRPGALTGVSGVVRYDPEFSAVADPGR